MLLHVSTCTSAYMYEVHVYVQVHVCTAPFLVFGRRWGIALGVLGAPYVKLFAEYTVLSMF